MCYCAGTVHYSGNTSRDIDVDALALMLNDSLRRPALKNKEIGILSFANLNNLEEVEPLGRHLQERLSHSLFNLGFRIVEIRLGKQIYFKPLVGELNLTRLKEKLKRTEFAEIQSLIMGTYIDAGDYIYVRSQFIDLESSLIRASGEIKIPKGEYLYKLIKLEKKKKKPTLKEREVYERFPSLRGNNTAATKKSKDK
jgi:hypothetical protein